MEAAIAKEETDSWPKGSKVPKSRVQFLRWAGPSQPLEEEPAPDQEESRHDLSRQIESTKQAYFQEIAC